MLKVTKETDNLYTPEYGVPTLRLGDGATAISDIHTDYGLHGICFSVSPRNDGVGADVTDTHQGKNVAEIGAFFQILTDNPVSLDVLIEKLHLARDALVNAREENAAAG